LQFIELSLRTFVPTNQSFAHEPTNNSMKSAKKSSTT